MPAATLRPCATPRCPALVTKGHCPTHSRQREQQRYNVDVRKWYHTAQWKLLRNIVLGEQPVCVDCQKAPSTEVDHKVPHRGSYSLFWDRQNLQGMCGTCHRRKTARGE
jgi:5-methylcytosine-specific restriction protein A